MKKNLRQAPSCNLSKNINAFSWNERWKSRSEQILKSDYIAKIKLLQVL
jgi:hypothetical protein